MGSGVYRRKPLLPVACISVPEVDTVKAVGIHKVLDPGNEIGYLVIIEVAESYPFATSFDADADFLEIQRALKIFREEFKDYLPVIALLISGLLCIGMGESHFIGN